MTATLNYIIEANLGLLMILAFYVLFLRKETRFRFLRMFLLAGIFGPLIFPLIHIENNESGGPHQPTHMDSVKQYAIIFAPMRRACWRFSSGSL